MCVQFTTYIIMITVLLIQIKFHVGSMQRTTNQINSRQMEQNVGCLKNVAINLCPLTW